MKFRCTNCGRSGPISGKQNFLLVELVSMGLSFFCCGCKRRTIHELEESEEGCKVHPDVSLACDQIDAAIFSGDADGPEGVKELKRFCERWLRGLKALEETFEDADAEEG